MNKQTELFLEIEIQKKINRLLAEEVQMLAQQLMTCYIELDRPEMVEKLSAYQPPTMIAFT